MIARASALIAALLVTSGCGDGARRAAASWWLLNDDNGFSAMARVDGPGLTAGSLPVVRLTGSLAGNEVTIVLPTSPVTTAATYVLVFGVAPAPEDKVPCPA
jgi:hypothetical protein